ncbi:MAG: phosphatidate cytidylyltransferase [Planctomycetes bacterium]|nr:phosphatidate cytidylyltransferase [Planctomycetota bacterium]
MDFTRVLLGSAFIATIALAYGVDHALDSTVCFAVLTAAAVAFALTEFLTLHETEEVRYPKFMAGVLAVLLVGMQWLSASGEIPALTKDLSPAGVGLALVLVAFAVSVSGLPVPVRGRAWATAVFGFVYCVFLLGFLLQTRMLPGVGVTASIFILVVTKGTDMSAMVFGRSFGRRPLAPSISPRKTVEGAIGGLGGGVALGLALWLGTELYREFPLWVAVAISAAVSVAGQCGDLAESMIKRSVGAKDSSRYLGELGGVLDMADAVTFSAPVGYLAFRMAGVGG